MSVTLNPAAIAALTETENGPVGLFVQRLAQDVVDDAAVLANKYYHDAVDVGRDIHFKMRGSSAIIGYDPAPGAGKADHKALRLAQKERDGMDEPPLTTAVTQDRH